jgi:hypothetical protein
MSFNSYPSADCSLIGHWAEEAEGKRAGTRGERANFYSAPIPCPLAPCPRLLLLPASQYHQMTLPTQHVVLVNFFIIGLTQIISQTLISPCPLCLCGSLRQATSCLRYSVTRA